MMEYKIIATDGRAKRAQVKMEDELFKLALAHRARGGARGAFLEAAAAQAARAYGAVGVDKGEAASAKRPKKSPAHTSGNAAECAPASPSVQGA